MSDELARRLRKRAADRLWWSTHREVQNQRRRELPSTRYRNMVKQIRFWDQVTANNSAWRERRASTDLLSLSGVRLSFDRARCRE